jgi:hypothetical protein
MPLRTQHEIAGESSDEEQGRRPEENFGAQDRGAQVSRHSLEKVLRIPKAILDQNAGKECSDEDTATFLGIKYNKGPYALGVSSAIKFGLLERPSAGRIAVSELAKKILRPQNEQERLLVQILTPRNHRPRREHEVILPNCRKQHFSRKRQDSAG